MILTLAKIGRISWLGQYYHIWIAFWELSLVLNQLSMCLWTRHELEPKLWLASSVTLWENSRGTWPPPPTQWARKNQSVHHPGHGRFMNSVWALHLQQTPLTSRSSTNYEIAGTQHTFKKDIPLSWRPICTKKSCWLASWGRVTMILLQTLQESTHLPERGRRQYLKHSHHRTMKTR